MSKGYEFNFVCTLHNLHFATTVDRLRKELLARHEPANQT